jgi:hypothetical protein
MEEVDLDQVTTAEQQEGRDVVYKPHRSLIKDKLYFMIRLR